MRQPYYEGHGVTLWLGESMQVLADMEPGTIGALITDPPYSSGGQFRGDRTQSTVAKYVNSDTQQHRPEFTGDNRDQRSFTAWCAMWLNAGRVASVPGAVLCSFIDWRQLPALTDAVQAAGWTWRNVAVWHKTNGRIMKGRFGASAEFIVYGTNGPIPGIAHGQGHPASVFAHGRASRNRVHIAQKPVPVMEWVLGVVPAGATVCDPFAGSGSTLVAARNLGHPAIGIECDEHAAELTAQRLEAEFGQQSA